MIIDRFIVKLDGLMSIDLLNETLNDLFIQSEQFILKEEKRNFIWKEFINTLEKHWWGIRKIHTNP